MCRLGTGHRLTVSLSLVVACLVGMATLSGQASGRESVELELNAEPVSGSLYREVRRPVDASLTVGVSVPPGKATITPMINSRVTFPAEMTFNPDPKVTPTCPADKVGPQTNLAQGLAGVVSICPRSVIGTGTAQIKLMQQVAYDLNDTRMVIFNAGRNRQGQARITIYAYSANAGSGLIMTGRLARNGELDIAIGVLPFDSSVSQFTLGIPGEPVPVLPGAAPDGGDEIRGQDPTYLMARCPNGRWSATGKFAFATRNQSTGELTSPVTEIDSNRATLPCRGLRGRPRLSLGVRSVRGRGTARRVKVKLRNRGTASARQTRIRVSGGTWVRVGRLRPGQVRQVNVPVHVRTQSKSRIRLRLELRAQGLRPQAKIVSVKTG